MIKAQRLNINDFEMATRTANMTKKFFMSLMFYLFNPFRAIVPIKRIMFTKFMTIWNFRWCVVMLSLRYQTTKQWILSFGLEKGKNIVAINDSVKCIPNNTRVSWNKAQFLVVIHAVGGFSFRIKIYLCKTWTENFMNIRIWWFWFTERITRFELETWEIELAL